MDKPGDQVSSFDCDIIRSAFIRYVIEANIPEDQWRAEAARLIANYTGTDDIDAQLLEWIVR